MGNISLKGKNLFIIFIVVLFLSIPVIASHVFQSETEISTAGSDIWTEANDTETMTITINVTGDYLNQTNITVPYNSSGNVNYSVDWATLTPSHDNWTCTNETNSPDNNVSKIICSTTPGNETQHFNITFDATAFNLNDSYQNWTIVTMDNNSETNTTNVTGVIGISPYLFDPIPTTNGWTNGDTQTFSVNVTDYSFNSSGVFRHWTLNPLSWPSTPLYNVLMNCNNYTLYSNLCNETFDLSGFTDADVYYYFYAYDNYTGYGSNGSNISSFVLHVDRVDPVITVNDPTNNTWHNGNMTIDLTVTDGIGSGVHKVWYNMTNTTWSNITYITNSSPSTYNTTIDTSEYMDGIYYIFDFYTNDSVNNIKQGISKYVRFDNTPPSKTSLEYPNAGMIIAGTINLRALINDNISGIDKVSFYNITEDWTDDGNGTWDPTENISDIYWNLLGTNTTGNSTAGYDHNWTFTWDTTSVPNGDFYLAINVTDKVSDPNYNESATLDIASLNGNGSNSSGGIFVQVRNTDPIVTFYAPNTSDTPPPLEWNVDVNFSIVSITGINLSTIQLNITNSTADEYKLYEFNATEDCTPIGYINASYFNMTFSGYNCSIIWYTPDGGEGGTTLDDQNLTLTASGHSIDVDNSSMKIPGGFISGDRDVTVNNSNAAPVITLMQPLNPYFSYAQAIDFTFYVQDNDDTNMTCDLYIDGVLNDTDTSVYNGNATVNFTTLTSSVISGTGTHPFMINCTDQKNNTGEYTSSIIINPEKIPYIILLPSDLSPYYDAQFHSIGVSMNATINNNSYVYTELVDLPHYRSIPKRATILRFDDNNLDKSIDNTLVGTIETFDAKHVIVIMHPQHATPDMIRKFNTLFKGLNDDPYIDVSWGIVTGKSAENATSLVDRSLGTAGLNQTTYHNYYEPDSMSFARSSAFAPLEQAYQAAAALIESVLDIAGVSTLYTGTSASNANIFARLDSADDANILYFAGGGTNTKLYGNETEPNTIKNDEYRCPFKTPSNETVECNGVGTFSSFKNRLVMFSTSDYFTRLSSNDTNASSWDVNNGNADNWTYQDSLILQMLYNAQSDGPIAFIGSTSVNWLTSESLAKSFFLNLLGGRDIGSALVSAKNTLILNHESVDNQTTKDFLSQLESSLVLYGIPQTDSKQDTGYVDYTVQNIQIESSPSTYDPISWNSTITISPKTSVAPLYLSGAWQSTYGTVWYQNVTEPSAGKINITFLAALAEEYIPDLKAYDLSVDSLSVAQDSFTRMTVEVERTKINTDPFGSSEQYNQSTSFLSSSHVSEDDFIYALKDNRSLIFAIPYSPNDTLLSSYSKTINLTFKTEGISIETISVSGNGSGQGQAENNITVTFNLVNPTGLTISGLVLKYPIPSLTIGCSVSGPSLSGSCMNTSGFAEQIISQVLPGKTQYVLNYTTDSNMTNPTQVNYDYGGSYDSVYVFNWGDNVTLKSQIASSSSFEAEIFTEIILLQNTGNLYQTPVPVNSIVWSNTTSAATGPSTTLFSPVWQVQENTSETQPGEYLVKVYILENETSKYLMKNIMYVNITDELNLNMTEANISSETVNGYIPEGKFNFTFSGSAKKKTGKYLNGTVIGQPSISVYLDTVKQPGSWSVTENGQFTSITLQDINPGIGNHTLTVKVFDEFNNTGIYIYPFNVTNIVDSVTIKINNSDDFTANEEDWVVVSGSVLGNGSTVFDADVTIKADGEIICTTKSTESGTYSCGWQVPYSAGENSYTISVDAISPLNITKTVSNSTTLDVIWLDVTIDPALLDIGVTSSSGFSKTVTAIGDVRYSEDMTNISVIEDADITCFIKDHLSWNKTITGVTVVDGKYSCIFSSGLNHTGTYTVRISASKSIDSKTVRGYKQQTFKIIDTSGGDDSGSSSTSPGSISPSNTTSTETTANLNFSYENTIGIEQGSGKEITIMITNNRDETLHNLTIALSGVDWTAWYVITSPEISSLSSGASGEFRINISVPEDADISDHTIEAKVTASESVIDDAISFTISVSPSEKTVNDTRDELLEIENIISIYNDRLKDLFIEFSDQGIMQKLLKPLNGTRISEAKEMLLEAKKLMVQSRDLLDSGETIEAFKAKRQADILVADIEKILEDEEQKLLQVAKILKILIIIIVFLTAVSALVGYMLLPPIKDTYTPKGEFFQKEIRKRPLFEKVSVRLQEILQGKNKGEHHSFMKKDKGPKGIKKIDQLHDKFSNYMKDDD